MKRIFCLLTVALIIMKTDAQTPEQFLPEIMNKYPNVRDMCISPDGKEMYFTVQSLKKEYAAIIQAKKNENYWTDIEIASFSGQYTDLEPTMSSNGLKLYFASNRPKNKNNITNDFDIWFVERKSIHEPWLEPTNLGAPVNTEKDEFYPSVAANGNIYFTASYANSKGKEDIYLAELKNGEYIEPYSLSESINTSGWEFNAYVAPDELYIIFSSTKHENNIGGGDLYISYKNKENKWQKAENLGIPINSPKLDFCPFVDAKTNTFYFCSEKTNINNAFKTKQNLELLLKAFNKQPNGMTRIYSLPFNNITK